MNNEYRLTYDDAIQIAMALQSRADQLKASLDSGIDSLLLEKHYHETVNTLARINKASWPID